MSNKEIDEMNEKLLDSELSNDNSSFEKFEESHENKVSQKSDYYFDEEEREKLHEQIQRTLSIDSNDIFEKKKENEYIIQKPSKDFELKLISKENLEETENKLDFISKCKCDSLLNGYQELEKNSKDESYYCFNCSNDEICSFCFHECHKTCNNFLKKIIICPKKNNKFFCACNFSLDHKVSKENIPKNLIENLIPSNVNKQIENIIFALKNKKILEESIFYLEYDTFYSEEILKLGIKNIKEILEKMSREKKKDITKVNFLIFSLIYMNFHKLFKNVKKLSLNDFKRNNFTFFKSYISYIKSNQKQFSLSRKIFCRFIHDKIKKNFNREYDLEIDFETYVLNLYFYECYIEFGLAYFLFDIQTLKTIIIHLHRIITYLHEEYLNSGNYNYTLSQKMFICLFESLVSYNYYVSLNQTKEVPSEDEIYKYAFENKAIGPISLIGMLKLIPLLHLKGEKENGNEKDFYILRNDAIKLIKKSFFIPDMNEDDIFLYENIKYNSEDQFLEKILTIKENILYYMDENFYTFKFENSNSSQKINLNYEIERVNKSHINEIIIKIKEIENLISKISKENLINYLIISGMDHSISQILKLIFTRWHFTESSENEEIELVEQLIQKCINILNLQISKKDGLNFFSIGSSYQIIEDIIFLKFNLGKKIITEEKTKYLYDYLYSFFYSLPKTCCKLNLSSIKYCENLEYRSKSFLPILNKILKYQGSFRYRNPEKIKEYFNKVLEEYNSVFNKYLETKDETNLKANIKIWKNMFRLLSTEQALYLETNISLSEEFKNKCKQHLNDIPFYLRIYILEALIKSSLTFFLNPFEKPKKETEQYKNKIEELNNMFDYLCVEIENSKLVIETENDDLNLKIAYIKHLLLTVYGVNNFCFTSHNLSFTPFKSFLKIRYIFESNESNIFQFLKKNGFDNLESNNKKNSKKKSKLEQKCSKILIKSKDYVNIKNTYQSVSEEINGMIQKYRRIMFPTYKKSIFEDFFKNENRKIIYSSIKRYSNLFFNNYNKEIKTEDKDYKKVLNYFQNEMNNFDNYVFNSMFSDVFIKTYEDILQDYSLKFHHDFFLSKEIFFLLSYYSSDDALLIILKILTCYNQFMDQLLHNGGLVTNIQNEEKEKIILEKGKELIENPEKYYKQLEIFTIIKQKILFYYSKCLLMAKTQPYSCHERAINCRVLEYIKLLQHFLDNFRSSIQYFVFGYDIDLLASKGDLEIVEYFKIMTKNRIPFKEAVKERQIVDTTENNFDFYLQERKGFFYIYERIELNKGTIFQLLLNIYEYLNDSIILNYNEQNEIYGPSTNLIVIFSAVTDFLCACISTFNTHALEKIEPLITNLILENDPEKKGGFMGCLKFKQLKSDLGYNFDVFIKIRLFDFLNLFLLNSNTKLFEFYKKEELDSLSYKYYDLLMFYAQNLVNKIEMKVMLESPITNTVKFILLFFQQKLKYPPFSKDYNKEEYVLLEKIFTFIKILYYDYHIDLFYSRYLKEINEQTELTNGYLYKINQKQFYIDEDEFNLTDKEMGEIKLNYYIFRHFHYRVSFVEINIDSQQIIEKSISEANVANYDNIFKENKKLTEKILNIKENQNKEVDDKDLQIQKLNEQLNIYKNKINEFKTAENESKVSKKIYFFRRYKIMNYLGFLKLLFNFANRKNHFTKIKSFIKFINYYTYYFIFESKNVDLFSIDIFKEFNYFNMIFVTIINFIMMYYLYKGTDSIDYNTNVLYGSTKPGIGILFPLAGFHLTLEILYVIFHYSFFFNFFLIKYFEEKSKYGLLIPNIDINIHNSDGKILKESKDHQLKRMNEIHRLLNIKNIENKVSEDPIKFLSKIYDDIPSRFLFLKILFYYILNSPELIVNVIPLLCDLLFLYSKFYILLAIPIICMVYFINPLTYIFKGLKCNINLIIWTFIFNLIILYIFMWFGFTFFSKLFSYDVIDNQNNSLTTQEPFCNSSLQCLLTFWSYSLFNGGTNDMVGLVSYKSHSGLYVVIFFYNLLAFIAVNIILANIYTGLTTDAFCAFRNKYNKIRVDKKKLCFLCDYSMINAAIDGVNFNDHLKLHSVTTYSEFLLDLLTKDPAEFNCNEKLIYLQVLNNNISWVPYNGEIISN